MHWESGKDHKWAYTLRKLDFFQWFFHAFFISLKYIQFCRNLSSKWAFFSSCWLMVLKLCAKQDLYWALTNFILSKISLLIRHMASFSVPSVLTLNILSLIVGETTSSFFSYHQSQNQSRWKNDWTWSLLFIYL